MKAVMVVRDPEAFQLLADGTRRKIIYLLRVKEMTASKLAAELGLTPQAVYHHIKKLLKGKLIEVAREERIEHLIESYYRTTAETFVLSHGKTGRQVFSDKKLARETMTTVFDALRKIGFNLRTDESKISQLIDIQVELEQCCSKAEKLEDRIYEMEDLDLYTAMKVADFARTIAMSDKELAKHHEANRKFRTLLSSMVVK